MSNVINQAVPKISSALGELTLSRVIFGAWRLADGTYRHAPSKLAETIRLSVECGITSFDHADIYGGYQVEELFGAALLESGINRQSIQLISKCGIKLVSQARPAHKAKHYDTSSQHIIASVNQSLKNLKTDYLDLLLLHRPDPLLDVDELAKCFDQLRSEGKVRFFGVSNFTPSQVELLASRLSQPLVSNQIEFGPLHLDPLVDGTLDQCQRLRILPMAWSPLAGGKLFSGTGEREQRTRAELQAIATELGCGTLDQIALAWILKHPASILPVLGTGDPQRIKTQAAACQIDLTREQWHRVWSASMGAPVP